MALPNGSRRTVNAALDTLADVQGWRQTTTGWTHIEGLVDRLAAAYAAGDVDEFLATTNDLARAGRRRTEPIGDEPVKPPPPPVRDRVNELVHEIGEGNKEK